MNSLEMLQSYCERKGLDAGDLAEKGLQVHFDGGLSALLEQESRTTVKFRVDIAALEGAADREALLRACLEANTALMGERVGVLTLDAERGQIILAGLIDTDEIDADSFEETLEDRLDEAERLMQLTAARQ